MKKRKGEEGNGRRGKRVGDGMEGEEGGTWKSEHDGEENITRIFEAHDEREAEEGIISRAAGGLSI